MASKTVNLDALIPRADFETAEDFSQAPPPNTVSIRDLERATSFFFAALRKPDFQRETSSWSSKKIRDFIKTFVEGDLVPAIILWRSPGGTFIIDGAHRLSAIIAWVDNDFGDGPISQKLFGGVIPIEQQRIADQTRKLVHKEFRTYQEHLAALKTPDTANAQVKARALAFGQVAIQLQWVPGNAQKAEDSFFKINREATLIQETELQILRARRKPNGLAARAMLRAGSGYKYWHHFEVAKQEHIEKLAKDIYEQLWTPILAIPIKTLDLPIAGAPHSAYTLPLVFEFITQANNGTLPKYTDDADGAATIECLKKVEKIANRISSKSYAGSLGLHPVVYFYSSEGRFQPTAFLAIVRLMEQFEKEDLFAVFTKHRLAFEDFIVKYKHFSNQITSKWGSGVRAFDRFSDLLHMVLDRLAAGDNENQILKVLAKDTVFNFLKPSDDSAKDKEIGKDFSKDAKSEAFLTVALKGAVRCALTAGAILTLTQSQLITKYQKKQAVWAA